MDEDMNTLVTQPNVSSVFHQSMVTELSSHTLICISSSLHIHVIRIHSHPESHPVTCI